MAPTVFYVLATLLLSLVEVTISDGCYSNGMKLGEVVGGDIDDPIKDFCLDHHGATFTEGGQAKGCVDTTKRKNTASLNITVEFISIPDESKAVNFTTDACKDVLMSVAKKCQRGGQGITVSFSVANSHTLNARYEGHSSLDKRDPMDSIQGRDASVPPLTAEVPLTPQNSTTNQPAGVPETSLFLNSTAKCNDSTKTNGTVSGTMNITTTLPITLTIPAVTHAGSTSTITTTTTSNTISTTTKRTTTTTITPAITSKDFGSQRSSSVTPMNLDFTAKVKMDPNDCGCAHC